VPESGAQQLPIRLVIGADRSQLLAGYGADVSEDGLFFGLQTNFKFDCWSAASQ
jgi:hypothetical protein